jgi:hypothetical protein
VMDSEAHGRPWVSSALNAMLAASRRLTHGVFIF